MKLDEALTSNERRLILAMLLAIALLWAIAGVMSHKWWILASALLPLIVLACYKFQPKAADPERAS